MMLLPDLRGKTGGSRTIYRSDSERSEGAERSGGVPGRMLLVDESGYHPPHALRVRRLDVPESLRAPTSA
jgi:hypothetical protein